MLPSTRPHSAVPIRSLAEVLNPAGYRCGMFGKWDLGGPEKGEAHGGGLGLVARRHHRRRPATAEVDKVFLSLQRTSRAPMSCGWSTWTRRSLSQGRRRESLEERRKLKVRLQDYMKQQCRIMPIISATFDIMWQKDIEDRDLGIRRYNVSPLERTYVRDERPVYVGERTGLNKITGVRGLFQ